MYLNVNLHVTLSEQKASRKRLHIYDSSDITFQNDEIIVPKNRAVGARVQSWLRVYL